jgi:hypothetical protein
MRHLPLLLFMAPLVGCQRSAGPEEFRTATGATIYYRFAGAPNPPNDGWPRHDLHFVTLQPDETKALLSLVAIRSEAEGSAAGAIAYGIVRFQLPTDAVVECGFITPTEVGLWRPDGSPGWHGMLYLKDKRFYDRCVQLAMQHEGGPVDLLGDEPK